MRFDPVLLVLHQSPRHIACFKLSQEVIVSAFCMDYYTLALVKVNAICTVGDYSIHCVKPRKESIWSPFTGRPSECKIASTISAKNKYKKSGCGLKCFFRMIKSRGNIRNLPAGIFFESMEAVMEKNSLCGIFLCDYKFRFLEPSQT